MCDFVKISYEHRLHKDSLARVYTIFDRGGDQSDHKYTDIVSLATHETNSLTYGFIPKGRFAPFIGHFVPGEFTKTLSYCVEIDLTSGMFCTLIDDSLKDLSRIHIISEAISACNDDIVLLELYCG